MSLPADPTEHPEYREWLQLAPQLFLHCRFNPWYDVLDGYASEPLSAEEAANLARYRDHCQRALKAVYDTLGSLPADREAVRTPATTFSILSRDFAVYGELTVLTLKCHGDGMLVPLPVPARRRTS